ncbi:MAG: hypothetical protein OEM64_12990, partial [Gammaproteobacteria bacterium]|nr:hypothetical protein [Gammaproteobacteria bacterium]
TSAIRWLEASPDGGYLIVVDANNLASQFILAEGRIAGGALQLPAAVREVTFASSGSHALFRTSRWVHRASSSETGLTWQNSVLVPKTFRSARIVAGNEGAGSRMYLPAIRNGFVELVELNFRRSSTPGLFGNKDKLLEEWLTRLRGNAVAPET